MHREATHRTNRVFFILPASCWRYKAPRCRRCQQAGRHTPTCPSNSRSPWKQPSSEPARGGRTRRRIGPPGGRDAFHSGGLVPVFSSWVEPENRNSAESEKDTCSTFSGCLSRALSRMQRHSGGSRKMSEGGALSRRRRHVIIPGVTSSLHQSERRTEGSWSWATKGKTSTPTCR